MSIFKDLTYEVYQILKSFGKTILMYDDSGNQTYKPQDSTRMFIEDENILLSFVDGSSDDYDNSVNEVRVYISGEVKSPKMLKLATSVRQTCNRFGFILTIKQYGKTITPRDFAVGNLNESMYGNQNVSFQDIGFIRITVNHNKAIDDIICGSRSRNISNIYLENLNTNERFLMPFTSLKAARALARHLNFGGRINDDISTFIEDNAEELQCLLAIKNLFPNYCYQITHRINEIRSILNVISGSRNYTKYYNMMNPETFRYDTQISYDEFIGDTSCDIDLRPYYKRLCGMRTTDLPVIVSDFDITSDIKILTKIKSLEYKYDAPNYIFFNSEAFSKALDIFEKMNVEYKLKTEQKDIDMDQYSMGYSFQSTKQRDEVLKNITDDFSYTPDEVFPVTDLKIGFANKQIFDELTDYIETLSPYAKESSLVEVTECDEPETFTVPKNKKFIPVAKKAIKKIDDFVERYDPEIFMNEAVIRVPGFDTEENAIHNSPELFNLNEFKNKYGIDPDALKSIKNIEDYLASKVNSTNPELNIPSEKFNEVARGVYIRYIKGITENINENSAILKILESVNLISFMNENKVNFENKLIEYILDSLKGSNITKSKIVEELKKYESILNPIFEAYDNPKYQSEEAFKVSVGSRVMTPSGKGTVKNKLINKRNKSIVWEVDVDGQGLDNFADKDVILMNKKTDKLYKIGQKVADDPETNIKRYFPVDREINEDDEFVTVDQIISDFVDDPNHGGMINQIVKKQDGELGISFIDDHLIAFLRKENIDTDEEDFDTIKNALIQYYKNDNVNVVDDINEEDDIPKFDMNQQTTFLNDVESERIFNPHQHNFDPGPSSDQKDQIIRLKALAGLSRNP